MRTQCIRHQLSKGNLQYPSFQEMKLTNLNLNFWTLNLKRQDVGKVLYEVTKDWTHRLKDWTH